MRLASEKSPYGSLALKAAILVQRGFEPIDAWKSAARDCFPDSQSNQEKGCPKSTFLGLASAGYLLGVQPAPYTTSIDNKRYAIEAVRQLLGHPRLAEQPDDLWRRVTAGKTVRHNGQMSVVIALWNAGYIKV
jgi:hypothetical protein